MKGFFQMPNDRARPLLLCVFVAITALGTSSAESRDGSIKPATADPAQLDVATKALTRWCRALVTLKMEFHSIPLPHDVEAPVPDVADSPFDEWIHTDSGQEYRLEKASNGRRLVVCDGVRRFQASYSLLPGDASFTKPDRVTISAPRGDQLLLQPLYGLWFNLRNEWLGDLLERDLGKYVAAEEVDGTRCLRVEVEDMPGHFVTVWLDPAHAYLPRRVITGPEGTGTFHNEITEFRHLDVGLWFPWSGEFWHLLGGTKTRHRYLWRMHGVRVGEPIVAGTFAAPQIPDGTHVVDETALRSYVQGGVADRLAVETLIANEANQNLNRAANWPQTPHVTARLFWPVAFAVFSLLVLALFYRSSRVKRSPAARTE
jgi:hypothetical protein